MKYAFCGSDGVLTQYVNDSTITTLPDNAVSLTDEQWENRQRIKRDMASGEIVPYTPPGPDPTIVIAQKTSALWQSAHDYEYQKISGAAFALLTLGVLQGKLKCIAVQGWIASIWTLYYQRKALITVDSIDDLNFSICGSMPYTIPELMQEVGA